jgi:hypothetical protein
MARKKRVFVECKEMEKMACELLKKYQGTFFGLVDPDIIKFALITSEKAKNAKSIVVEENPKDWIQEATKLAALVAVYEEDWEIWSTHRKEWEIMEALQLLPIGADGEKHKPDVCEYAWRINAIGVNWREKNDKGKDLPSLINFDEKQLSIESVGTSSKDEEEIEFPD